MNDTANCKSPPNSYWSHLVLMVILGAGAFFSIEYVPMFLNGAVGTIVGLLAASIFLYSFGSVIGQMIADNSASKPTPEK